jgi:hypothetical protein
MRFGLATGRGSGIGGSDVSGGSTGSGSSSLTSNAAGTILGAAFGRNSASTIGGASTAGDFEFCFADAGTAAENSVLTATWLVRAAVERSCPDATVATKLAAPAMPAAIHLRMSAPPAQIIDTPCSSARGWEALYASSEIAGSETSRDGYGLRHPLVCVPVMAD